MENTRKDLFIRNIFSTVAPRIDFLSTLFSFGLCSAWRKKAVALSDQREDDRVLDACTGTGELAVELVKNMGPRGSLVGVDFCPKMLDIAREKMNSNENPHPKNVSFVLGDAKRLSFQDDSFDLVTVGFGMRNIPDTIAALREVHRVLKPGGRFTCLELTKPENRWFLPFYSWYLFHVIPFIGKLVMKTAGPYSYLPVSIDSFYSPGQFGRVIARCGFADVGIHPMTLGTATIFTAHKEMH